jgi:hypothetical protein
LTARRDRANPPSVPLRTASVASGPVMHFYSGKPMHFCSGVDIGSSNLSERAK